jgi:excisionase family DNA binding protein
MTNSSPVWMSRTEAAAYLRCSLRQVDRYVEDGKLTRHKLGRSTRFRVKQLDALLTPEQREAS